MAGFDPDAYLAKKGTGFNPDAYLASKAPAPMKVVGEGGEELAPGGADKPTKFMPPFSVPTEQEKWDQKSWIGKLIDVARGQGPLQTQKGIDQTLSQANAGPGTEQYAAMERLKKAENMNAGAMLGGGVGGAVTKGLLPLVATVPGRIAAGTIGSAVGGGAGASTEAALNRESPAEVAEAGKKGFGYGAVVGAPLSAVGEGVAALAKNAPTRVAERELAGLKEGVQYKTRVQKFEPNEEAMRAAMGQNPQIRSAIKADARTAQPMVDAKFRQVADESLAPFYEQMANTGTDGVPAETVLKHLQAARKGFNSIAEKSQIAVLDDVIADVQKMATENGGKIPAQFLRETATSFQQQGYSNLNMFGPVQLSKQLKQDVGNGIRQAIADHVETLSPDAAAGKALREAFENGNREVALWYRIKDIVDEKARRLGANASPMGDLVAGANRFRDALKHPLDTGLDMMAGPIPEALDRAVLAPVSKGLDMLRMGASGAGAAAGASAGANPILNAAQRQRDRDRQLSQMLLQGGRRQ